jgi:PAS domain S-box-containing protein
MSYTLLQAAHTLVEVQAKGLLGARLLLAAALAGALVVWKRSHDRKLRASEARIRGILDAAPDATIGVDVAGRIVFTNAAAVSLFGFSQEELMGMPIETLVPRALAERHAAHRAGFSADPKARPMGLGLDLAAVRKDGTLFPVDVSLSHIRMGDETTTLAAIRDVTERKQAEEALRESEQRFRSVLNNSPITIFVVDEQGVFTVSEGKGLEKVGLKPGDNVGVSAMELYGALAIIQRDGSTINGLDARRRVMAGGTVAGVTQLNGEYFDNQMVPDRDAAGRVRGMIGVATNITERKLAADAAAEAQERTRAQFRGVPSPIYAWRRSGDDFVLTDYNIAAEIVTDGRVADFVGMPASVMYSDRPDIASEIALCFTQRMTTRREMQYRFRYTDRERLLSVTFVFVPADTVLVHTEDITDRRQAQARLEESQRELRALATHLDAVREDERATLGRNLHDDLGQVLTALKMDVRALRRRVAKGGKMSSASLDPVDELVDGLIATSRQIVSELHAPVLEGLTLRDSVELQAAEFIRRTRVHCDVTCTPGDLRLDDRMALLLYRIVQESLTNVARYAAATAVTIAIRAAGDDLVLLIEDNGRGIAAERSAGGRFGIIGMRERTLALGGQFAIRGGVHGGTVIEVVVPFGPHDAVEGGA